jgi:hypothetical protein
MATFIIKRGDTLPALPVQLRNPDGSVPNLAGATVLFKMSDRQSGALLISRAAAIVDLPTASVTFTWLAGDTVTAGLFSGEFQVTFVGGAIATYPNQGFLTVSIPPDL